MHEGSIALFRQSSNGHFQLPSASKWLKFYRELSTYPYRQSSNRHFQLPLASYWLKFYRYSSEVSNIYRNCHFLEKFNMICLNQSIFLASKRKCTIYRIASKTTVNVTWQEFLPFFIMKVPPLPPSCMPEKA